MENENCKFSWDFTTHSDCVIQARRPDIVVFNKRRRTCQLIYVAYPADWRVGIKEEEKIGKYKNLTREIDKLWNLKVKVIPLVIGALRTGALTTKGLDGRDGKTDQNCTNSDDNIVVNGEDY